MTLQPTRRAFLQSAPFAATAIASPAVPAELPVDKVNRLARELSLALNDYADGTMHAEIHPSQKRSFPIGFVVTDMHIPPMIELKNQIQRTKEAMAKAYPERNIHAYSTIEEGDGHATVIIVTGRAGA